MTLRPMRSGRALAATPVTDRRVGDDLGSATEWSWTLPALPATASVARGKVRQVCGNVPAPCLEDIVLVTSELVTNAVLHARGDLGLRVRRSPDRVRVEVTDSGGGQVTAHPSGGDAETGRGLFIVTALAASWGVAPGPPPGSKSVWCEVDTLEPVDVPDAATTPGTDR